MKRDPIFVVGPSIAYIPLTRGLHALVDSDDAARVAQILWQAQWAPGSQSYYARHSHTVNGRRVHGCIHHAVLGLLPSTQVDHRSRVTLDNRRANLRVANNSQNRFNSKLFRTNLCGLKGVQKRKTRWVARIKADGKRVFLGSFGSPQEAHAAYRTAAARVAGEFARFE